MVRPTDPTTCPECKHVSVYTTEYYVTNRTDPEAWAGKCTCSDPARPGFDPVADVTGCTHQDEEDGPCESCCRCEWES